MRALVVVGILSVPLPLLAVELGHGEAAPADSLNIARTMAERGESSVAATQVVVRQLSRVGLRDDDLGIARAFQTLSIVLRLGGDIGNAITFSDAALILANHIHPDESPHRGTFLLSHALAARLSGRPGARKTAEALVDEGIVLLGRDPRADASSYADLLQARANLIRSRRDHSAAISQYEHALEFRLRDSTEHALDLINNECWLASVEVLDSRLVSAEQRLLRCEADLNAIGLEHHPLMPTIRAHLAMIAQLHGDDDRALRLYERASSGLETSRTQLLPGFSQRRLDSPIHTALAYIYLQRGESQKAWAEYAAEHETWGAQARALAWARRDAPDLALRVRESATSSPRMLGEVDAALRELRAEVQDDAVRRATIDTLVRFAMRLGESFRMKDALRRAHGLQRSAVPSITRVQRGLASWQAIVGYMSAYRPSGLVDTSWETVTYAVVIRDAGEPEWIEFDVDPEGPDFTVDWRRYRKLMQRSSEWPTRLPDDLEMQRLLHALYVERFEAIESKLSQVREIILLPSDLWSGFPFPALVDNEGRALIERFAIRHSFGSGELGVVASSESVEAAPCLVLGDPAYGSSGSSATAADPNLETALSTYALTILPRSVISGVLEDGSATLNDLPRLVSSGWEARGIASMAESSILLVGDEATEQSLDLACGGRETHEYRWIHLAAHALMHKAIPERSALALSPSDGGGLLHVEEIGYGWNVNCDLVTLSGCQTGAGPVSVSAGPLGFVQALHAAGARNLLLSSAKVDDVATALFMERFYANVSNHASPRVEPSAPAPLSYSAALAEAQRWLRDLRAPDGGQPFAHPVYWANFRLIGSGG